MSFRAEILVSAMVSWLGCSSGVKGVLGIEFGRDIESAEKKLHSSLELFKRVGAKRDVEKVLAGKEVRTRKP